MTTPREHTSTLSGSSFSKVPRPCRGLQSSSTTRTLLNQEEGEATPHGDTVSSPKLETSTELSTAAGSLLGRRQRMSLSDPKKRSKRIKGSPPPPKLARKRMVVSGPPHLTHKHDLDSNVKYSPPPLVSLTEISDPTTPDGLTDAAETPSTTSPSSTEDRPSPSSSGDRDSQPPSSPKGPGLQQENESDKVIRSEDDEINVSSHAAPPLGGLTTVNAGAMTCTDLAYLLSIDGFVGAIRLRDGLFLGDQLAATDQDFFNANVVLYVVNCCDTEVPNHFDNVSINNQNIQYLSFAWQDVEGEKIFTPRGTVLHKIYDFIEGADAVGASCLVHSKFGKSRAVCVVCGYLMMRYRWSAKKALEFLIARRPDLTLRRSFVRQILAMEHYLSDLYGCEMSSSWDEKVPALSPEELLLRNTFKNSFAGSEGGYSMSSPQQSPVPPFARPLSKTQLRITWKGRDEIFEPTPEDECISKVEKPIRIPKESSLPPILKSRPISEPTSSRTSDQSPTEAKRARSLSTSPVATDKGERQKKTISKVVPSQQSHALVAAKAKKEALTASAPHSPSPNSSTSPSATSTFPRATPKDELTRPKSKNLDKGVGLVGLADRLRPRAHRGASLSGATTLQSDLSQTNTERARSGSQESPFARCSPLGISKRHAHQPVGAKNPANTSSAVRSAAAATDSSPFSGKNKSLVRDCVEMSSEHVHSLGGHHGPTQDTKVLWGSPRIPTPVLTLDLDHNVLKRRLASQPAKSKGKSRSLSPVVLQSMRPTAYSTPSTTVQMSLHRQEHSSPQQHHYHQQDRSPPAAPPPQSQHRTSLTSLLTPLKATFSTSRPAVRATSSSSLHPWRTTIADLPLQDPPYSMTLESTPPADSSASFVPQPKRNSLQSPGKQQHHQTALPRLEDSLFSVPRGQQRVASNTVEYRQSRPLANPVNLRLRAISSSRASLPKSDFPSSSLMGLKREPEPSRHNTLPPSPTAKVQVQRGLLAWESGPMDSRRCLSTGRPSQISSTTDLPATSHITFRDGIAVTQHIAYSSSLTEINHP